MLHKKAPQRDYVKGQSIGFDISAFRSLLRTTELNVNWALRGLGAHRIANMYQEVLPLDFNKQANICPSRTARNIYGNTSKRIANLFFAEAACLWRHSSSHAGVY